MSDSAKGDAPANREVPADLARAGAILEEAVQKMRQEGIHPHSAATAMFGGAMHIYISGLPPEQVMGILANAMESVRTGKLKPFLR